MTTLTPLEERILDTLGRAWNMYLRLDPEHPTERAEFAHIIHDAQARILMRPTRRALAERDAG